MRFLLRVFVLASALSLSTSALSASTTAPASKFQPALEPSSQDPVGDYRKKLDQAQSINSKRQLEKLFRDYPDETVITIIETAEAISIRGNEVLYKRMNTLRTTWKEVYRSEFCEKMETYFSLLDGPRKRQRSRLKKDYLAARSRWIDETQKGGSGAGLGVLGFEFTGLAEQFKKISDEYYVSQCWLLAASCFDEGFRGPDADFTKAEEGYRFGLAVREKIGLRDRVFRENRARLQTLQGLGFGPQPEANAGGEGAGSNGTAGGEASEGAGAGVAPKKVQPAAPVVATTSFEAIAKYDRFKRPNFFLDEQYPIWFPIGLGPVDSKSVVGRMNDFGLRAIRSGSAKVGLDEDGDGTTDVDVPLRGKPTLVTTKIGTGSEERETAFLAVVGIAEDTYQTVQVPLQPQENGLLIYTVPAGSMVGEIAGTAIRVIDEDMDGVYGGAPKTWGFVGLVEGSFQPEIDSVVIGSSKRAVPFASPTKIGDVWYKLESQQGGKAVKATPIPVQTGSIKLAGKGLKPDFLVVTGAERETTRYYDIAGGKAVEVPVGVYKLYFGKVSKGKKRQLVKGLILPGESTPTYQVKAGETVKVTLGAPYGFDFKTEIGDGTLKVAGDSVAVTGVSGERYERLYGCVPRPEISYRKVGTKRGSKGEKMGIMLSQEDIYKQELGFRASWFPYDTEVKLKPGVTEVEVQLTEKKNKLFGSINSAWKP